MPVLGNLERWSLKLLKGDLDMKKYEILERLDKIIYALPLLLILLLIPNLSSSDTYCSPMERLSPKIDEVLSILDNKSLRGEANRKQRHNKLMAVFSKIFDFGEMSKRMLGSAWKKIDKDQQQEFTSAMIELLKNNYLCQIEKFSDREIEYLGERIKKNRAQVSTYLCSEGNKIPVHFIMILKDENWMVYDINIEGVSLVRNYKAEFSSIIRQKNFEGLLETIRAKNRSLG